MRLKSDLPAALKYQAVITEAAAREVGLDFFEVVFELLDAKDVNGVASYGGFPIRYPSWRFGMEFERMEKSRRWGLSKIYELVINNDPTYAYLVRSNSMMEQKLVMAHVYGHADFFKNNLWFAPTDRKMLDTMANHSTRVRRYIDALGREEVERFLDTCLSLETLVDPYLPLREHANPPEAQTSHTPASEKALRTLEALSSSPLREKAASVAPRPRLRRVPTYDVLGYLAESAPLEAWQQDILRIVRAEAYYFVPQRMTKVMNEGWASYWHSKLLTGGILEPHEILDFADCHSGATAAAQGQVNPYKLGIALFRHAEALGEDIFQLRRVHKDVSMIHKLVDEEFAHQHILPILMPPGAVGPDGAPAEPPPWEELKSWLLKQLSWGGLPQIELIEEGSQGELILEHHHEGRDLLLSGAGETLLNLEKLWKRPVHLRTIVEDKGRLLIAKGGELEVIETAEPEAEAQGPAEPDAA